MRSRTHAQRHDAAPPKCNDSSNHRVHACPLVSVYEENKRVGLEQEEKLRAKCPPGYRVVYHPTFGWGQYEEVQV